MKTYSTRDAAKKLGITGVALGRYIQQNKVPSPTHTVQVAGRNIHAWTEAEIEHVRQLLPKIANGRKTRYSKLRKEQRPQPRAAVPYGSRKTKMKSKTNRPKANG
jgi:predicted DNA-binding transcriptional regulator AlpA